MFSKSKNRFLGLAVSIAFASAAQVHTVDAAVASINEANLPINVSNQETAKAVSEQNKPANALVSPSRAKAVANTAVQAGSAGQNNSVSAAGNTADAKVSGNSDANAPAVDRRARQLWFDGRRLGGGNALYRGEAGQGGARAD